MIEAPERTETKTDGGKPPSPPRRPPTTGLLEPSPGGPRRPSRYHGRMAQKVIASVFIIVIACILGSALHPALYLLALIALLFWL